MAVLTRVALVALISLIAAGCYQPTVLDCTVTCAAAGDCAAGQVCAGGWCASPHAAGTCAADPDASVTDGTLTDAARPDAARPDAARPDAFAATLRVVVQGRGKVVVEPLGVECVGIQGTPGDCSFPVMPGSEQTLLPVTTHPQTGFSGWTTDNCSAQAGACTLTMVPPVVLVGATFGS